MNKIICDRCKAEIQMTKDLIETKHLKDGIQINFFRCGKCGEKYLVDVTDRNIRIKQSEMSVHIKLKADLMKRVNKDNIQETEEKAKELDNIMDKLEKEIKEAKAELKKKYEGEL
jgi:uncharacterized Zn finger protein